MIKGNSTEKCGGGIYCKISSNAIIRNNIITKNHAIGGGGGIACRDSRPEIINNVITGNSADSMGGGLHFEKDGNALVCNSIILGNGLYSGYEISMDGGYPEFKYCNMPKAMDGEGNIEAEPYFRNAEIGDFHLMSVSCGDRLDSPCIDAGDPDIHDDSLGCDAGLGTNCSDMGAFGGNRIDIYKTVGSSSVITPAGDSEK
ncbi:MAG: right-handed parallel beta-helix repeat-containing protein [Candidatus Zixiibacteriota bacterium]|nr:MAG: right-handed parallel beta-helix repeat-containing protein [candidate division Zixibacteria bacterium]